MANYWCQKNLNFKPIIQSTSNPKTILNFFLRSFRITGKASFLHKDLYRHPTIANIKCLMVEKNLFIILNIFYLIKGFGLIPYNCHGILWIHLKRYLKIMNTRYYITSDCEFKHEGLKPTREWFLIHLEGYNLPSLHLYHNSATHFSQIPSRPIPIEILAQMCIYSQIHDSMSLFPSGSWKHWPSSMSV